ncbi:MAG TPA: response regulator, partial [Candidatus Polarisedimenticolaceae bacterium]|nr:response regulator [Candidatus Polarisedimenticolaceae bacterium]
MGSLHPRTTVYVLEDDASVRNSLGRLMRSEGYDVRLYESAERFLAEVAPPPLACLLLDITLPDFNGLEVQRTLNDRQIRLPVIAISARDDDAIRLEARKLGAKFFFRKPVDDRTLI